MQILGKLIIEKFANKHPQSRGPLRAWVSEVEASEWETTQDIKQRYAHASFLNDNRVIFNIGGNKYRLEVKVQFRFGKVLVLEINTHAEYDKKKKNSK
ncbi:MAG: type II toxin-antitoxin system HigB family toxin [Gammaproteobacteria bacterium]|nr:type II toxin-antitoxin system HigB family toxin [Gammaproteobacteria bacterium]